MGLDSPHLDVAKIEKTYVTYDLTTVHIYILKIILIDAKIQIIMNLEATKYTCFTVQPRCSCCGAAMLNLKVRNRDNNYATNSDRKEKIL